MNNLCISQYHFEISSLEIAREIFVKALGLEELKLKYNNRMASFRLDKARLYCQVLTKDEENKGNIMHSIHLYSPLSKIHNAYEYFKKNKRLKVRLSTFGEKSEYTLLDIYTPSPVSFIHISNLKV